MNAVAGSDGIANHDIPEEETVWVSLRDASGRKVPPKKICKGLSLEQILQECFNWDNEAASKVRFLVLQTFEEASDQEMVKTLTNASKSPPPRACHSALRVVVAIALTAVFLVCGGIVLHAIERGPEEETNRKLKGDLDTLIDTLSNTTDTTGADERRLQGLPPGSPVGGGGPPPVGGGGAGGGGPTGTPGSSSSPPPPKGGLPQGGKPQGGPPPGGGKPQRSLGYNAMTKYFKDFHGSKKGKNCQLPTGDDAEITQNWTPAGATFFAMTLVTTIGYGSFAPSTDAGRAFSVVYSMVGIVIFGQCLSVIISAVWLPLFQSIEARFFCLKKLPQKGLANRVAFALVSLVVLVPFMVLSSIVLMHYESWSFWESMYFLWITFSTIGLGDLTPDSNDSVRVAVIILHAMLGLSLVAALVGYLTNILSGVQDTVASAMDVDGDGELSVKDLSLAISSQTFGRRSPDGSERV